MILRKQIRSDSTEYKALFSQQPPETAKRFKPTNSFWAEGKAHAFELLHRLPEYGLAIVGTRRPQTRSINFTQKLINDLRDSDLIILSGLARGIDQIAHETALAVNLPTLAIQACGLNQTYPPENETLKKQIIERGGLILTEQDPDQGIRRYEFLNRNRLIVYWSKATVIIEASQKSGAINSGTWARDLEKDLFVIPCYPGDLTFAGNQKLLETPSPQTYLLWSAQDLITVWPSLNSLLPKNLTPRISSPLQKEIFRRTLATGGISYEELEIWASRYDFSDSAWKRELQDAIKSGKVIETLGILATSESRW